MLRHITPALLLTALIVFHAPAHADLPMAETTRWEPIADDVYLQEVSSRIETDAPLLAVAVFNHGVFLGHGNGVSVVQGDKLVKEGGPTTPVRRMRVLDDSLWAIASDGLWRYAGGTWQQMATGAYVDVCLHRGDVVAATKGHLYALNGGLWVALDGKGSRRPILGVSSYSETLYVRHQDSLAFLHDGQYEYNDVHDWGHLPRDADTRDILTLGSRLLVPTSGGLSVLRGMSWQTLTGADGLPYEDTTCVAEGFDGDYWVGTTRGAVRAVDGEFHYFGYARWLPHEKVNAIACGDDVTYIATDGGLGIITYEPYTLQKKSAWFKQWIKDWNMRRLGFISVLIKNKSGEYVRYLSDNDVGWICHYLDALCFEYAVTGDKTVRDEAVDVFKSIKWSEEVTPIDGFPARAIYAVGEEAELAATGSAGRPSEWNLSEDGKWRWKGDTSSDEVASQYYSMAVFYELIAKGNPEEPLVKEHVQRMTDHIIGSGWCLRDLDGKPTVWAQWSPDFINDPIHVAEHGLNSGQALAIIATARHIVGDTEKYRKAQAQLEAWGYPQKTLRTKMVFPYYTHFDDRLAFLTYYPLLNYETDARLRAIYMRSLQRGWEVKRMENQTWFNYIYGALTGNEMQNEAAIQHLRDYPLEAINFRFTNSHRDDLAVPDGFTNYVSDTKAMGPREQGVRRWDRDPLELDGGGTLMVLDPSSYLDAYWMGRYYGFISAPTTKDPKLLEVDPVKRPEAPQPYNGPPRPKLWHEQ